MTFEAPAANNSGAFFFLKEAFGEIINAQSAPSQFFCVCAHFESVCQL